VIPVLGVGWKRVIVQLVHKDASIDSQKTPKGHGLASHARGGNDRSTRKKKQDAVGRPAEEKKLLGGSTGGKRGQSLKSITERGGRKLLRGR